MCKLTTEQSSLASLCSTGLQRNRSDALPDYGKYSARLAPGQARRDGPPAAFVGALGPLLPPLDPQQPQDALDAALRLAAAGLPVFPMSKRKRPILAGWQHEATTDPAIILEWWGRRGRYRRAFVGIALRIPGFMALDTDTAEAAEAVAQLAGVDLAVGWVVASAKGIKAVCRRPARLALENGNRPAQEALGGADSIMGAVLAWSPGRVWYGDLAAIGDAPAWLERALADVYPERPPQAPLPPRPTMPRGDGDGDRLVAYVLRAIIDEGAEVAILGDGRKGAMYVLGLKLGALVAGLAPQLERDAWQEAERACAACGLALRVGMSHFANGWRDGAANPRPIPHQRELGLGSLPPQERATLEARAAAAAADVDEQMREVGVHHQRRPGAERLVYVLVARCLERGSDTVAASYAELARDIGVAEASTVLRCIPALEAIGWTVTRGGINTDGSVTATRWTMPQGFSRSCNGLLDDVPPFGQDPLQLREKGAHPSGQAGLLGRGLRRTVDGVAACGGLVYRALGAMRGGQVVTAAELGDAIGCRPEAAARLAERMVAHDAAVVVEARDTGGRPGRAWKLAADVLALLAAELDAVLSAATAATLVAGARVIHRAQERLEAGRRFMAEARARAQEIGASVGAVLAAWRDRDRQTREIAAGIDERIGQVRRDEARASRADALARWSWSKAITYRDLVAEIGLVTTW